MRESKFRITGNACARHRSLEGSRVSTEQANASAIPERSVAQCAKKAKLLTFEDKLCFLGDLRESFEECVTAAEVLREQMACSKDLRQDEQPEKTHSLGGLCGRISVF